MHQSAQSVKMKISVIVPTFRPKEYTIECLESLKQQTLSSDLFEILVILNGEREPYYSFLQQAIPPNGKLFYSPIASACSSRNLGLDNASGEYITFIDDDDKVSPTYLEELLAVARFDVVAASNLLEFYDDGRIERDCYSDEYERYAAKGEQPFYRPKKIFSLIAMKLIHRDVIGKRRFNLSFPSGQDALLMFEISDRIKKVRFTSPKAIYYWRQRGDSLHKLPFSKILSKYSRLAWAYTLLYFRKPLQYNFRFYLTRLLASVHAILVKK